MIRLFDNLQVIANTNIELPDVVGKIRSVQGSGITKETTRVVIRLVIDPEFMGIMIFFLDEKVNSMIHGFISAGRANYYMPSLKAGSIVKVDHFEIARCSSMYKITDHSFIIRFISPTIIDEVITGAPEINLQS
ncbi:hypothetical protein F2Q69_00052092 [Brassica cretica]|uniref:Replication protein A 70 kDa DNA-binding subunit B/D first OB fold domain-containing protein n=1 Tax=Brassica cretica TaxID=69181 RepID=A0A8S9N4Q9_BRACR|nr:hypothetical protein F2Q69_00052092 [Brassica cretica]